MVGYSVLKRREAMPLVLVGSRDIGFVDDGLRQKREPKAKTRCGCKAEMKMDAVDVEQMNMMLKVGIKMPQIYSSFVHTIEGFQNVPFLKRDMYNQIGKQRRLIGGDAMSCLKFLESTVQENPGMYVHIWPTRMVVCQTIVFATALVSPLHDLEMSASNKLTKEIFFLFNPMLFQTCTLKIVLFLIVGRRMLATKKMCVLPCGDEAEFVDMMDKVRCEISRLKEKKDCGDL
ncbi:Protein FAR1-RELATED SEQUENCE [Arachis hypogaea]|nr:Protein FAR1-RELATED SEQUENCE [Arachis hypogaea]